VAVEFVKNVQAVDMTQPLQTLNKQRPFDFVLLALELDLNFEVDFFVCYCATVRNFKYELKDLIGRLVLAAEQQMDTLNLIKCR
jgi:hypothetical protein